MPHASAKLELQTDKNPHKGRPAGLHQVWPYQQFSQGQRRNLKIKRGMMDDGPVDCQ